MPGHVTPESLRRAPQKSHKSASQAAPTRSPRTRRHSAAHPGTHAKIEAKTSPEQAKRRYRRLSAVPIVVVRGRIELPTFRFSEGLSPAREPLPDTAPQPVTSNGPVRSL